MTTETVEQNTHAANVLARMSTQIEGMDVRTLGTVLVKSGYFQDTKELAQAVVKVLAGKELGFGPIASMQGVYIVNGRVSLASNLIAAAIQRSGRFRYRVTKLDSTACSITFYERWDRQGEWQEIGQSTFTEQDAAQAELNKKATYKQFPRNMLFARALTNGARWFCPEVFNGPVYTPDELGASVDDEGRVIDIPSAPPRDTAESQQQVRRYDEIFGAAYADDAQDAMVTTTRTRVERRTGEVIDEEPAEPEPPKPPSRADLWQENRTLIEECEKRGIMGLPVLNSRSTEDVLVAANEELRDRLRTYEAGLHADDLEQAEAF